MQQPPEHQAERAQRILAAIEAYTAHVEAGGDGNVLRWIVGNVEDGGIWYALIDILNVIRALGHANVATNMLTPAERTLLEAAVARVLGPE